MSQNTESNIKKKGLNLNNKNDNERLNKQMMKNEEEKLKAMNIGEEKKKKNSHIIWCMNCCHGGHVDHMREWFEELTVCPNSNCECICLAYNLLIL